MNEILSYVLTGATAAATIKLIDNVIQWLLSRKAKREDVATEKKGKAEKQDAEWRKKTDSRIDDLAVGVRMILLDRIRHVGQAYLRDGEVDFDDRRLLNAMHDVYHRTLGGNGDLDVLMNEVNELPLKER